MSAKSVLYLDLTTFIADCQSYVTERKPLVIRTRMFRTRWGVECSIKHKTVTYRVGVMADSQTEAVEKAHKFRETFRKTLHHVA